MVAQDEVLVGRERCSSPGDAVAVVFGDVVFVQRLAVDVDLAGIDLDRVAGDTDDALDVRLRGSSGNQKTTMSPRSMLPRPKR